MPTAIRKIPEKWLVPVVTSVVLPAHAQTSLLCAEGFIAVPGLQIECDGEAVTETYYLDDLGDCAYLSRVQSGAALEFIVRTLKYPSCLETGCFYAGAGAKIPLGAWGFGLEQTCEPPYDDSEVKSFENIAIAASGDEWRISFKVTRMINLVSVHDVRLYPPAT